MELIDNTQELEIIGAASLGSLSYLNGSVSVTLSPDSQELSILFDQFSAINGQVSCSLVVPLKVPAGYQISLYNADYRGFVAANTSASIRVAYSFSDQSGSGFQKTFQEEVDYNLPDRLVTLANVRSPDGDTVNLYIDISLTANGDGIATLDSLDLAHQGNVYYPSFIDQTQSNSPPELLDFRESTHDVNATFSIYRDAFYNNTIYFYSIQDETGSVFDISTNTVLQPTDPQYLQVALYNAVAGIALATPDQTTTTVDTVLSKGSLLAPAIVINGQREALLDHNPNNDPVVYTPFVLGNADKTNHILRLSDNTLVFEDLPRGGDLDYNDIIIISTFQPII